MARNIQHPLRRFVSNLEERASGPPKIDGEPDIYLAHFDKALVAHLEASTDTQDQIINIVSERKKRTPVSAKHLGNFVFRLCQSEWMNEPGYPFDTESEWRSHIDDLFSDPEKSSKFRADLRMYDVGSDVETRAAGPLLVAQTLHKDRVQEEEPYKILSIGSSRDHGLAMIAGGLVFPRVLALEPLEDDTDPHQAQTDVKNTQLINHLLAQRINLGPSIGVDKWVLNDPSWARFIYACRFYPLEFLDVEKRRRYDNLEEIRDTNPNLKHVGADFSKIFDPNYLAENHRTAQLLSEEFDMVYASWSFYQNYARSRRTMAANAIRLLNDRGLFVIQDGLRYKQSQGYRRRDIDDIEFPDAAFAKPFEQRIVVYDKQDRAAGFQPFGVWNNTRCEKFIPDQLFLDEAEAVRSRLSAPSVKSA